LAARSAGGGFDLESSPDLRAPQNLSREAWRRRTDGRTNFRQPGRLDALKRQVEAAAPRDDRRRANAGHGGDAARQVVTNQRMQAASAQTKADVRLAYRGSSIDAAVGGAARGPAISSAPGRFCHVDQPICGRADVEKLTSIGFA
jgi:hypothetical protein